MANLYASRDLYIKQSIKDGPKDLGSLYNFYGLTKYTTVHHDYWYYLTSDNWLVSFSIDNVLYDSSTDKFFTHDYRSWPNKNTSWLNLHELAKKRYLHNWLLNTDTQYDTPISPSNEPATIWNTYTGLQVPSVKYTSPIGNPDLYYIHPDHVDPIHLGWRTKQDWINRGYSFEEPTFGIIYNVGTTSMSHINLGIIEYE